MPQDSFIEEGPLRIRISDCGIQLFWSNRQISRGVGLNVAVNTLGLWTNSSKAKWQLLRKDVNSFSVKISFDELPLVQLWNIEIQNTNLIIWNVEIQNTEWLHVDELRIVHLLTPDYTSWFCGYEQGKFFRFEEKWRDLLTNQVSSLLVGVRFPREGVKLPALSLETDHKSSNVLIQNSSFREDLRIVGFSVPYQDDKCDFAVGSTQAFKITMKIFQDDFDLDHKIELLRRKAFRSDLVKNELPTADKHPKILLVNLPWYKNGRWGVRAGSRWPHTKDPSEGKYMPFPFFLAQATSLLQKNSVDAQMIDAIAEGLTEDAFMNRLLARDINYLVAETSVPSFLQDMEILKKISELGIKIILCGPNSLTYQTDFMRQYPFIDFVLKGEYEFTLLELIRALENKSDFSQVAGMLYNKGGEFMSTSERQLCDIDSLPWPHRSSLPMDKYWDLPGNIPYPSVQMSASRGCPFNCNFCLWPQVMYQGGSYRIRDVKDVVDEMEHLVKNKGFKSVYFDDDTFNVGKERMLQFCQIIKQRGLESIPWAIMARADLMDKEMLEEMRSAGLWAVKYGVESFVQDLVEKYGKNMNLLKTADIIKTTQDLGIKVHLTFCFGIPGETKESIQRTIDFALEQNPESVQFSILTPFPGTRLFKELDDKGMILTKDWSKYDGHSSCVFSPEGLSVKDLEVAKHRAYQLWQESKRRKRGFWGDLKRFFKYLEEYGLYHVTGKTFNYLKFVWFKRGKYLNGTGR